VILETTVIVLKLLCANYKSGKIDLLTFCLHAKLKVLYLKENVTDINSLEKEKSIQDLVDECESIFSYSSVIV